MITFERSLRVAWPVPTAAPIAPPRAQRPEREPDRGVRRSLLVMLVAATLFVVGALGIVALRVHQVRLAYRLDALRAERARGERLNQQLEIEIATLTAPGRLEPRAREIGMIPPTRGQVRLAREYVPGGRGTASADLAAAEVPVR